MDCPVKIRVARVLFVRRDVVEDLRARTGCAGIVQGRRGKGVNAYKQFCQALMAYVESARLEDLLEKYLVMLPDDSDHLYHNTGRLAKLTANVDPLVRKKSTGTLHARTR